MKSIVCIGCCSFLLLSLLVRTGALVAAQNESCMNDSLVNSYEWIYYEKDSSIKCDKQSKYNFFCNMWLARTDYAHCTKEQEQYPESGISSDSYNITRELELWECESSSSWIIYMTIECPKGHSICTNPMGECHVLYDPINSVLYIGAMAVIVCVSACCFCFIIVVAYASQCFFMVETSTPSKIEQGVFGYSNKRSSHKN
jgi:hypothetical protein